MQIVRELAELPAARIGGLDGIVEQAAVIGLKGNEAVGRKKLRVARKEAVGRQTTVRMPVLGPRI